MVPVYEPNTLIDPVEKETRNSGDESLDELLEMDTTWTPQVFGLKPDIERVVELLAEALMVWVLWYLNSQDPSKTRVEPFADQT